MAPRQIQELMLEDQMWELIIKDQDLVYMALTDPKMEKVYSEVLNNKNAIMKYIDDPQVMSVFVKSCAKMATSLVVEYLKKDLREEIKSKLLTLSVWMILEFSLTIELCKTEFWR